MDRRAPPVSVWGFVWLLLAGSACSLKQGESGPPSLSFSDGNVGSNCPAGGVAVHTGVDANRNGVLDPNESTQISYLCAGSADTPGQVLAKLTQVDGPGSGLDADTLRGWTIEQLIAVLQPAGTVVAYAGDTPPQGWLLCDGSEVRRNNYPALFTAIGTRHGSGDGLTTFNLPDYRGRFLRGVDEDTGRDPDRHTRLAPAPGGSTGDTVGSVQGSATALPVSPFATSTAGSHVHGSGAYQNIVAADHSGTTQGTDNTDPSGSEPNLLFSLPMPASGSHSHSVVGGDSETRPKNANVYFVIRY